VVPAPAARFVRSVGDMRDVNDVHSKLNPTRVRRIEAPPDLAALRAAVARAREENRGVAIAGCRHAMGGQQFATDEVLIDMRGLNGVIDFDPEAGTIEVGSGVAWPELMATLDRLQAGVAAPWGIVQKQTGADRLSLGGALAANVHGRGLAFRPIVQDVEAFTLVDAEGRARRCSRTENAALFTLAIGGYGLLGVIATIRLRLMRRHTVMRVVEVTDCDTLAERFADRIADGFTFGDFQFATDPASPDLLHRGVLSCYRPVADDVAAVAEPRLLTRNDWLELIRLAHVDRTQAFERYAAYYLSTDGQTYASDRHQLTTYIDDYHAALGEHLGHVALGTEMITEIYVPRAALASFLAEARRAIRTRDMNLIYGTIRLIERDDETVLAWAREPWACIIFNLHTQHGAAALAKTADDFRRLIDCGLGHGGSYFLTYHRWATREQVLSAHPRLPEFLAAKRRHDPDHVFVSDWYCHHRALAEA